MIQFGLVSVFGVIGVVQQGFGQASTTSGPSEPVNCTGEYSSVTTRDELYKEILPRVLRENDSDESVKIKSVFLQYLTSMGIFLDMINCNGNETQSPHVPRLLLQEDEDDGDEDGGGGGGNGGGVGGAAGVFGALTGTNANPLDNTNVLNGVRRILANVFTGNLVGVLQESVSLRSPESVSTVFTDVLSTLFGSAATAGITGIVGNVTTTPSVLNVSSSTLLPPGYEAYIQQHYLQQQYLAQQQQLLLSQQNLAIQQNQQFGVGGGVGGVQQQQQLQQGGVPQIQQGGVLLGGQQQQQLSGGGGGVPQIQQGGVLLGGQQPPQLNGGTQNQYVSPQHQHLLQQQQYLQQTQNQQVVGNRSPVNNIGGLQNQQPIILPVPVQQNTGVVSNSLPVQSNKPNKAPQTQQEEEYDEDNDDE